jgi:hypothetical protein
MSAVAYLRLIFVEVKVFDATIWSLRLFAFKFRIGRFTLEDGKPVFKVDFGNVRIDPVDLRFFQRSITKGCGVNQVPGRDPTDTAVILTPGIKSSPGRYDIFFAAGSNEGGKDVLPWTKLTKMSLLIPFRVNHSIPLYWTVKVQTSDGQQSITKCYLKTYDNTLPDGRIDAMYPYTSHPNKLGGKVVVFDESKIPINQKHAVGLSREGKGNQVIDWRFFNLTTKPKGLLRKDKLFDTGKEGKLVVFPLRSFHAHDHTVCSEECIRFGERCVSYDFEFHTETCDLHSVIQGPKADLRISGTYKHFERLDIGHSYIIQHDLHLLHGQKYFINAEITNVLKYKSILSSHGTMVDFTPPEPNNIGTAKQDQMVADECRASRIQRCDVVTWRQNHRYSLL